MLNTSMQGFRRYLNEANALRLLDDLDGRTFGIINGGKSESEGQPLRALLNNLGYNLIWIEGMFKIPAEGEKKAKQVDDLSYVVIAPEDADAKDFSRALFRLAVRFKYPNFLIKPDGQSRVFVVGAEEHKWPGLKMTRPFAEYTPTRFVSIIEKYKGDKYTFGELIEDRDIHRDDPDAKADEKVKDEKEADAPPPDKKPVEEPKKAPAPVDLDTPPRNMADEPKPAPKPKET